jgi:hypothetical protein
MAFFKNNRNNGQICTKAPSQPFSVGQFLVPTGLGNYLPYAKATTVLFTVLTGTFVLGETVTQATSGATGVVLAVITGGVYLGSVTGTFDNTHVITGGTSTATGTATSVNIAKKIYGIANQMIQSTDADYAKARFTNISVPTNIQDYLTIPVSSGTAVQTMEGTYVDVDPATPDSVIVGVTGTQIYITKVVSASMVEGLIALHV